MTESQSITGKAIKEVWEPLFGKDDQLNAEQKDMFDRCRELVQTSNFQQGVGPTAFKIEEIQTNEQLAAAVQQVSQVAKLSQMTGAVKSASAQFTNIGAHLLELRQGVLPQLLVGAYKPTPFVSIADANVADSSFTGGGASADSALPSQKLGVFVNGNFVFGNRDGTSREDGLDFDNKGFTAGVDYRFTDDLALGLAFGFNNVHTDLANGAGDSDTNSYTVSTFGNYYVNNFFVTGIFSYAALDHEISRTIAYPTVNRQANGDTNGDLYGATLGFGYDFYVDKFTVSPLARVQYAKAHLDGFRETGAQGLDLQYGDQDIESLLSTLGATANYAISTDFGVLLPQLRSEWHHEFKDDSRRIGAQYVNDPNGLTWFIPTDGADRNYFTLGAAISGTFAYGLSAFINYESILGLSDTTVHVINVGLRAAFL